MIFLTLVLTTVFWPLWFYSPNIATDYPLISDSILNASFNPPYAWIFRTATGLGENSLFTLWSWPVDFLYGLLYKIGFNYDLIQLIIILSAIFIASFSINKILLDYKISYKARIASILFYTLNSYFLLLIDGGQLIIALAYAFLPLNYYYFYKSINSNFINRIKAGLLISISGFFDIRFVYMLVLVLGLRFIFDLLSRNAKFFSWIKSGIVVAVIFVLIHFYWIWPVYNFGLELPSTVSSSTNIDFLSFAKLKHALLLLQPHWYKNAFGVVAATRKEFLLIPIFAFSAILFNRKTREIYFWLVISILGILLVKGNNPPFDNLYAFLFEYLPGFFVFRDPSKFYFLIALGYSILIGFTLNKLVKVAPAIFGIFIIYTIFLIRPVYLNQMTGILSSPNNTNSFKNVEEILKGDGDFGRVLWVPKRHPLAYVDLNHPVVEATRIQDLRPFFIGNFGTYETQNFLREGEHVAQLLNLSGIKYIAYAFPDAKKRELSEDEIEYYDIFSSQLANKDYLEQIYHDNAISLYKLKLDTEKFFIAENNVILNQSDEIYDDFNFESEYRLKNNALIINNSRRSDFYYPSDYLTPDPTKEGWPASRSLGVGWWARDASQFAWARSFLEEKYLISNHDLNFGGGFAICEGECEFTLPQETLDWPEIYIRKLVISEEIVTRTISGHDNVPDQKFEYQSSHFEWQKVDPKNPQIQLDQDINIINALSPALPEEDVYQLISGEPSAQVSYKMINPSHYKLTVTGISKPSMLVFSETYNTNWILNEQHPVKVYDLFNGFIVFEDGEYDLYFKPQEYVDFGLKISLISAFVLTLYILRYGKNRPNIKD